MFRPGRNWLIFAAVMSFSGTALHAVVVLIGAPAYLIGTMDRWKWLRFNGEPNDDNTKPHLKA